MAACEAIRAHLAGRATKIVEDFPAVAQRILAAKTALEGATIASSEEVPAELATAFEALEAEARSAQRDLRDMGAFVRLHEPIAEDGNNFYVGVQDEFAKGLEYAADEMVKVFDKRVEYLEKRAGFKEKIKPTEKEDTETVTQTSTGKEEGESTEKEETKKSKSNKTKEDGWTKSNKSKSTFSVVSERVEVIQRLDQQWQAKVAALLTNIVYVVAQQVQRVQLNSGKLMDPRGEGQNGGGGGRMYF